MNGLKRATRRLRGLVDREYRLLDIAARNSLCDPDRLRGLSRVAEATARRRLEGAFVECGVYRGGSAAIIADALRRVTPDLQVWLFDVFTGMPEPGSDDPPEAWKEVGLYASSEQIVRETFAATGFPLENLHVVPGLYERTLPGFQPMPLRFLHVDCDWYEPVRLVLQTFFDAVVPGGAVVFDDYGHWSGCRKAVDAFLAERGLHVTLTPIDRTSHYFVKP